MYLVDRSDHVLDLYLFFSFPNATQWLWPVGYPTFFLWTGFELHSFPSVEWNQVYSGFAATYCGALLDTLINKLHWLHPDICLTFLFPI